MGTRDRLQFALERLKPGDWELFEKFASSFLSPDHPAIRTMADPSGDGGRDSELFSSENDTSVVFQYSVTKDWNAKIHDTVKRLAEYFADNQIKLLIFVSSQEIGAKADKVKRTIRENFTLMLDIYDRNWFLERVNNTDPQLLAAEELAEKIVDPIIKGKNIASISIPGIDGEELPMARKLAVLIYRMLRYGQDYVDVGEKAYEERFRRRRLAWLKTSVVSLGYDLIPRYQNV